MDEPAPSSQAPEGPTRPRVIRATNVRSCLECRRRKIRCDRKLPCGYCVKNGIQCIYPRGAHGPGAATLPPDAEPDMAGKMRRMEAHIGLLEDRLARLEEREAMAPGASSQAGTGSIAASSPGNASPIPARSMFADISRASSEAFAMSSFGQRVGGGSGSGGGISQINTATPDIRQTDFGTSLEASPIDQSAYLGDMVFQNSYVAADLGALHPPTERAFTIWQLYLENVDPLLKIFHAPTLQAQFLEASRNTGSLSSSMEALMFAIYYATAVSVKCDAFCLTALQEEKMVLIRRYRAGCELAFARAEFMTAPDFITLQALTLFLSVGRRELPETYVWSMTGLAIRIATRLNLHRDPGNQGYSPFICELRRRLWWILVTLETRSAEGTEQDPLLYDSQFDTKMPLNINDCDLDYNMATLPQSSQVRTDMMNTIIRYEICLATRKIAFSPDFTIRNGGQVLTAAEKNDFLDSVWAQLSEKYFQHLDNRVPLCLYALAWTKLIIARLKLMLYHPVRYDRLEAYGDDLNVLVRTSIEIMEHVQGLRADERYSRYLWLIQKYIEWDPAEFILLSLNLESFGTDRQDGLEERAWKTLELFFKTWHGHVEASKESKWQRLTRLLESARAQRLASYSMSHSGFAANLQQQSVDYLTSAAAHSYFPEYVPGAQIQHGGMAGVSGLGSMPVEDEEEDG